MRYGLSLTTAITKEFDPALPGEFWFLYWRTSASLWKNKLAEVPGTFVLVPINWSFHSENGEASDFGTVRPETDLQKLVALAHELGKVVHFLISLNPAPFLPNGGIPPLLARWGQISSSGLLSAVADGQGPINKLYSFYDPRVFQAYARFIEALANYMVIKNITASVWGMECGYIAQGQWVSYLNDRSKAYETAFARYIAIDREERQLLKGPIRSESELSTEMALEEERIMEQSFNKMIAQLYIDAAKNSFKLNWEGVLKMAFLGGSEEDFHQRSFCVENTTKYAHDMLEALTKGVLPSTVLLPGFVKKGVFWRQLEEMVSRSFLPQVLAQKNDLSEENLGPIPLVFFDLYFKESESSRFQFGRPKEEEVWRRLGILDVLVRNYKWTYRFLKIEDFRFNESEMNYRRIAFLSGSLISSREFSQMLKLFMNGGILVIDRQGMASDILKKCEAFFLENNIEIEKINYQSIIAHMASLGDGRMLLVDGLNHDHVTPEQRSQFWHKALSFFDIPHLGKILGDEVQYTWRTRRPSSFELNYEEVRRLALYNHSSYKKRVKIPMAPNFALAKIIDEYNVVVQSYPQEIEVQLLPEGSVSLDFGLYI